MIRINLLPFRAARKKENVRRQVSIYVLSVGFLFIVMAYFFLQLNSTLNGLKEEEQRLQAELKTYEATIRRIAELEKQIKEIRTKLDVIKELEKNKTGPVHLLDEIATAVPRDRLWLTSLKESGGILTLTGTAMDNETVALFMTSLEQSDHISTVDLQSSRLRNLAQYRLNVADFVMECRTYAFKEPPRAEPARTRRR